LQESLFDEFKKPSSLYRAKPFWAWNGRLNTEELCRQIRIMHKMGFGGFFMHSRTGLTTPYLSDEWFECVKACCNEAETQQMEAWLYDEDRYPSGSAGGMVTKNPVYRQQHLKMDIFPAREFKWSEKLLCAFAAHIDGHKAYDVVQLKPDQKIPEKYDKEVVLTFHVITAKKSSWFNGQTYLDTLSYEAVQKFIEITHEQYHKRLGSHFGKIIPGIFTDEPSHETTCEKLIHDIPCDVKDDTSAQIPWTGDLPDIFRRRYGYNLIEQLPSVFFDIDGVPVQKARHDYSDCRTFLLSDAFSRQIGDWCEQNNLTFTGHVLFESPIAAQASVVGSAMRFYEYMQAPGVDILTAEHTVTKGRPEYDSLKQCSSVQHQLGRKWMLSELYGCTGWDFSFEGFKAVGDWQAALGVNLRCPHLSWYTMEGEGKRDFPPSISYQSPWWKNYSLVEDYFSRINAVMSRGSAVRNLLVIHPNESIWQFIKTGWTGNEQSYEREGRFEIEKQFTDLCNWLLKSHIDFDYGDEDIISRLGDVDDNKNKPKLRVGKATYDVMLIPDLLTIRSSTLELAERFIEKGGRVVLAGNAPEYVDAIPNKRATEFFSKCIKVPFNLKKILNAVEPAREISIQNSNGQEEAGILYLCHREDSHCYIFLCNLDDKVKDNIKVNVKSLGFENCVEEWDAVKGKQYLVDFVSEKDWIEINTSFESYGSRLFVFPAKPETCLSHRKQYNVSHSESLVGNWEYSLSEPNVLVLDKVRFKIGKDKWYGPDEILRVDKKIRDICGIPIRSNVMVQPWAQDLSKSTKTTPVKISFNFSVDSMPTSQIFLAIERPKSYQISLNNSPICHDTDAGWWTDRSIRLLPIDLASLKVGQNSLTLSMDYGQDYGLEAIFLLGQFGVDLVDNCPKISFLPKALEVGDWTRQGLPFYSGSVIYRQTVKVVPKKGQCVFVEIPEYAGVCFRVLVNGKSIESKGWAPYEVDITDAIDCEKVDLAIEVFAHRRNSFGPLHLKGRGEYPGWTGSYEFVTSGQHWQDEYRLVACGLLKAPVLSYKDTLSHKNCNTPAE
jgi:hypothetical protein